MQLKRSLLELFMTDAEWSRVFTSWKIDEWYAEFESRRMRLQ